MPFRCPVSVAGVRSLAPGGGPNKRERADVVGSTHAGGVPAAPNHRSPRGDYTSTLRPTRVHSRPLRASHPRLHKEASAAERMAVLIVLGLCDNMRLVAVG